MSVLLLSLLLIGFAPTFFLRPLTDHPPLSTHLYIHGAVLTGWFGWLVVQTSAVRRGEIALHRRLGLIGVGIGAACVIGGPLATLGSVRSFRAAGLDWDSDMSEFPIVGIEGISMENFAAQLVLGNFGTITAFAILLIAAVSLRRNAPAHKRLMLFAAISLMGPVLARISRWPGLGGEDSAFIPLALIALMLSVFAHDLITTRRVHRAIWIAAIIAFVTPVIGFALAKSPFATELVRSMD